MQVILLFAYYSRYIQNSSQHPLVIHGPSGSGKTVLMAKLAQSIHDWLPDSCFAIRYGGLTHCSQDIPSILESIVHQIGHIQSKDIPINPHVSCGATLKDAPKFSRISLADHQSIRRLPKSSHPRLGAANCNRCGLSGGGGNQGCYRPGLDSR